MLWTHADQCVLSYFQSVNPCLQQTKKEEEPKRKNWMSVYDERPDTP